jgi:hypothetical protein
VSIYARVVRRRGTGPENPTLRYLSIHNMDERAENDTPPDPVLMQKMGALIREITVAGVLESVRQMPES